MCPTKTVKAWWALDAMNDRFCVRRLKHCDVFFGTKREAMRYALNTGLRCAIIDRTARPGDVWLWISTGKGHVIAHSRVPLPVKKAA